MKITEFRSWKLGVRIFLITIFYILFTNRSFSQVTYDSVASYTSKTSIDLTDIIPYQTKVLNKYTWRKITGQSMFDRITDTLEARITTLLAASNSWDGINNFDGAIFNTGAHGRVIVNDSLYAPKIYAQFIYAALSNATLGTNAAPFSTLYSQRFTVVNPTATDTATISYDGTTISMDKPVSFSDVTITQSVNIDSGGSFRTFTYSPHSYQITDGGDTVLTLSSSDRYSLILLGLPANMATKGISNINVEGATIGMVLGIINHDESYDVKFVDYVGNDDNLYIGSDFTASFLDYIELLCIDDGVDSQQWILRFNQDNN